MQFGEEKLPFKTTITTKTFLSMKHQNQILTFQITKINIDNPTPCFFLGKKTKTADLHTCKRRRREYIPDNLYLNIQKNLNIVQQI